MAKPNCPRRYTWLPNCYTKNPHISLFSKARKWFWEGNFFLQITHLSIVSHLPDSEECNENIVIPMDFWRIPPPRANNLNRIRLIIGRPHTSYAGLQRPVKPLSPALTDWSETLLNHCFRKTSVEAGKGRFDSGDSECTLASGSGSQTNRGKQLFLRIWVKGTTSLFRWYLLG